MKTCAKCKVEKPLSAFNKFRHAKDGLKHACRECDQARKAKAYYEKLDHHRALNLKRHSKGMADRQRWIYDYLLAHPCVDCGEADPVVLEFHHLRDKKAEIATMVATYGLSSLEQEVAKCEILCANCHTKRTIDEFGYHRTDWEGGNTCSVPHN